MTELYPLLKQIKLFSGVDENDLPDVLKALNATVKHYDKSDIIMHEGDSLSHIGLVLSGSLQISRTDYAGNRLIIGRLSFPSMFAEALAFSGRETSPVSLATLTKAKVLFIDFGSIIIGNKITAFQGIIASNMLKILAEKNLFLQQRLSLLSKRSTRAKLSAYLLSVLEQRNNHTFDIPFNRFALSDYLCVNRSAMSKELSRMRDEGIIEYDKFSFIIHDTAKLSHYANQPSQ